MKKTPLLDQSDRRILVALQQHPDASIAEIGERVGMSQTPCWRRIKRMQEAGVIKGREWLMDGTQLGLTVNVFAELRLKQHDEDTLERLEACARAQPAIVECFSMSGDSDYLLRIVVESVEDYEIFLKRTLLHMPGIASINSSFALKAVKLTTNLPIPVS